MTPDDPPEAAVLQSVRCLYDGVAERYEEDRARWLQVAGGPAEAAMHEDLAAVLRPGARVLDAGCGTGALAREILRLEPAVDLTLLDASTAMLAQSGDIGMRRVVGDVMELPFPDDAFDIVVSAWVIETVAVPACAVEEYLRVLAPGGLVVYTFCSLPDRWWTRAATSHLRALVNRSYAGDFIPSERIPWHDCARSHLVRFRGGLTSEVALGKCCSVDEALLPTGSPTGYPPSGTESAGEDRGPVRANP